MVDDMELCGLIFIILFIALGLYLGYLDRKRVDKIKIVARSLHLRYHKKDPYRIAANYKHLNPLRQGHNRYAYNVICGTYRNQFILMFDYHFETYYEDEDGEKQIEHHYLSGALIHLSKEFPELICRPEGFMDKAAQSLGFDDIDLDNYEFSKKYVVKCTSQKFAYDIFHPRMMECMLRIGKISLELEKNTIFIHRPDTLKPELLRSHLNALVDMKRLFPKYLLADSSFPDAPEGPRKQPRKKPGSMRRQPHYTCPSCSGPLTYIQQYQRWYCYHCQRYA